MCHLSPGFFLIVIYMSFTNTCQCQCRGGVEGGGDYSGHAERHSDGRPPLAAILFRSFRSALPRERRRCFDQCARFFPMHLTKGATRGGTPWVWYIVLGYGTRFRAIHATSGTTRSVTGGKRYRADRASYEQYHIVQGTCTSGGTRTGTTGKEHRLQGTAVWAVPHKSTTG